MGLTRHIIIDLSIARQEELDAETQRRLALAMRLEAAGLSVDEEGGGEGEGFELANGSFE